MCGRYIENSEAEIVEIREILKQISLRFVMRETAMAEVFPTNEVLIIRKSESLLAKWGFPKWDGKGVLINAKSETYESSRFWSKSAGNRCIVPAHGYYEWGKTASQNKIKYVFTGQEKHGIFMCGIYNRQGESSVGFAHPMTFAIITKPADENIQHIHRRMPLIVGAEQAEAWLNGRLAVSEIRGDWVSYKETGA